MNGDNIYLFEGEDEKNFIQSYKSQRRLVHGKTQKANLWHITAIGKLLRLIPRGKKTNVFVVFDTDKTCQIERFVSNIKALSKASKTVVLLPQHEHFEDEIAFACGNMQAKDLPHHLYKCSNTQALKKNLAQDKNLFQNLNSKGVDESEMWSRLDIKESIGGLNKNVLWGVCNILNKN